MITNPAYYDVAFLLSISTFGTLGVDLFGGAWEAETNDGVLVLDGVGVPSELKALYEQLGIQIIVRGAKGDADLKVYRKAKPISDFMLSQPECVTINGVDYLGFEEASNLFGLGKDTNERFVYSMNFRTYRNRE